MACLRAALAAVKATTISLVLGTGKNRCSTLHGPRRHGGVELKTDQGDSHYSITGIRYSKERAEKRELEIGL